MCLLLPYAHFIFHDSTTNPTRFAVYADHLTKGNFAFFAKMAKEERRGFLFTVKVSYDQKFTKFLSSDFSSFPFLYEVTKDQLGRTQANLTKDKRIRPKLVSACITSVITDFVQNLSFMQLMFSMTVEEVKSVVTFTLFDFLNTYVQHIAQHRSRTPSTIMQKTCKVTTIFEKKFEKILKKFLKNFLKKFFFHDHNPTLLHNHPHPLKPRISRIV